MATLIFLTLRLILLCQLFVSVFQLTLGALVKFFILTSIIFGHILLNDNSASITRA